MGFRIDCFIIVYYRGYGMKFIIHGTCPDDSEDEIIIEGETIKEIQDKAKFETELRNWSDCWSEQID